MRVEEKLRNKMATGAKSIIPDISDVLSGKVLFYGKEGTKEVWRRTIRWSRGHRRGSSVRPMEHQQAG